MDNKIFIQSLSHLANYLNTMGVKTKKISDDTLQVSDGLLLVYDNNWVIPTGFDNGRLYAFTNDITNLLINYVV